MIHAILKLRITTIVALLSFLTLTMVPTNAVAQPPRHAHRTASSFVQGTDGNGNAFSGIVTITSFATQGNQLVANGVVNGTLTSSDGTATPIVGQRLEERRV